MSERNIHISNKASDLSSVVKADGNTLLSVWSRELPNDVQTSLDNFDVKSIMPDSTLLVSSINISWPDLKQIEALKVFKDDIEMLTENYKKYIHPSINDPLISIFADHHVDGANCWHRDSASGDLSRKTAGIVIYNSHTMSKLSGEFNYIAPQDEQYMRARTQGDLEYTCLRPSIAQKLPLGNLGVIQHGQENGLIHKATSAEEGYRWRVLLVPQ